MKKIFNKYSKNGNLIRDNYRGFTLIEIIIAVTIFSIMMVSVIFIFVNSSEVSMKIDINRSLQENSKNIIETIAEDLRKNSIKECGGPITEGCRDISLKYSTGTEVWIGDNHYYLAKENNLLGGYIQTNNLLDCDDLIEQCYIMLRKGSLGPQILSNSSVKISNLEFTIFSEHIPKVQINFLMKPMVGKGIRADLIKNNEINIQTTLSERYLKQ